MNEWLNHAALQVVRVLPGSFDPLIPPGLDRRPKVFGIGFHKTGTSTLGRALRTLGYRVQKGRAFNHPGKVFIPEPVTIGKIWDSVQALIPLYAAFEDNPWPLLYREIDAACPGSKFIFTFREPDRWLKSASRYFSNRNNATLDLIYGQRRFRIADNESLALARYEQHNAEIRDYFRNRPHDILEWNLEAEPSWEPLCRFLNSDVPAREFPHANAAGGRVRKTPHIRAAA